MRPAPRCPLCAGGDVEGFFVLEDVPVHCNLLWPTPREARRAPRGDVRLTFCRGCGMIWNAVFDPTLVTYRAEYENSLHFSPRFQRYAEALAARLAERYPLRGRTVVAIGCGKGEFLALLARTAGATGVGFDPAFEGDEAPGVRVIRDLYSEAYADQPADFIVCRHTLEHVEDPLGFLATIRKAADPGTPVYVEVPNGLFVLRDLAVWDVIYEHPSYFVPATLRYALEEAGFEVEEVAEAFEGQFLSLEGRAGAAAAGAPRPPSQEEVERVAGLVRRFSEAHRAAVERWTDALAGWLEAGRRVALWGAGSKGVTFLNTVPGGGRVEVVVDVNPRKAGRHVPGTGQRILPPEALERHPVDAVVVMNPIYEGEIRGMLDERGIEAEVVTATEPGASPGEEERC